MKELTINDEREGDKSDNTEDSSLLVADMTAKVEAITLESIGIDINPNVFFECNSDINPTTIEIDMVEYDVSSLAIALYGNQTKSIEDGVYTMYDSQNNIYKQYNLFEIRDQFNELLYEVRQDRGSNIDYTKNFTTITG
jgi:hypothetical protein